MLTVVRVICAWCASEYGGWLEDWRMEPMQESHGICERCALVVLREDAA